METLGFPFDYCPCFVPEQFEPVTCTGAISNPVHDFFVSTVSLSNVPKYTADLFRGTGVPSRSSCKGI